MVANDVKFFLMPIVYNGIIITNYKEKEKKKFA